MSRHEDLSRVLSSGIVAVIRSTSSEQLVEVARALYEGGVDVLEVTFTVPRALEIIAAVRKALGDKVLLGAGTVLDPETARAAFLAGAEFLVSPTVNLDVIKLGNRYDKLVMPGAFTPTEILTAWEAGGTDHQGLPGRHWRSCVSENAAWSFTTSAFASDRRREPEHDRRFPESRCLRRGPGRCARRAESRANRRHGPHQEPRAAICRGRQKDPRLVVNVVIFAPRDEFSWTNRAIDPRTIETRSLPALWNPVLSPVSDNN